MVKTLTMMVEEKRHASQTLTVVNQGKRGQSIRLGGNVMKRQAASSALTVMVTRRGKIHVLR